MTDLTTRIVVLVVVLAAASAAGWWLRSRAGVSRRVDDGAVLAPAEIGVERLGARATYLQLSSPACAPCRAVTRVLADVVRGDAGLAHVEVDATRRLDLARRLEVMRTPTVLVLDPAGRVTARFNGVPTPDQARDALPAPATTRSPR